MKGKNKGITLIALVVTIVVLIILSTITVNWLFGENGIIKRAQDARDLANRETAREAVGMGWMECQMNYVTQVSKVEKQEFFETNIKEYIDKQNKQGEYIEKGSVIDVASTSTVKYDYKDKIYTFYVDEDGNVTYAGEKKKGQKEEIPRVEVPSSEYKLVGDIYCNSPDLSGFSKEATYYVTYDDNGNEKIAGRIDTVNPPDNWYDYSEGSKKWANVVTITENEVAYWVWIPKYVYSLDTANEGVNVHFVSKETSKNATEYQYKTKDETKTISATEYQMPESFEFGGQNLAGFWASKYEVSESTAINTQILECGEDEDNITVTTNNPSGSYKVYVDGVETYTGTLPYTLTDLVDNAKYDICVVSLTDGPIGRKEVWTRSIIQVDTSGFNKENTFYVTYDSNGNETYRRLDKGIPVDWYNYSDKKWANLVTINNNEVAYWTYIPRYEYKTYHGGQIVDVKFITKNQTEADGGGYTIPESFTFGGQNLAGFWTSKYEISESTVVNTEIIECTEQSNSITVTSNNPDGEYYIYQDGNLVYTGTLPYTISGLKENTTYDISLMSKSKGAIGRRQVKTSTAYSAIEVDLSGFNKQTTYYVLYSDDGQTVESENIPISTTLTNEQKEKWYNYSSKKWANIKTTSEDGSQVAYWTYIPRYEYISYGGANAADVKFIPKSQTVADGGYTIPESFTFAGKNLAGFWVAKYEVSE